MQLRRLTSLYGVSYTFSACGHAFSVFDVESSRQLGALRRLVREGAVHPHPRTLAWANVDVVRLCGGPISGGAPLREEMCGGWLVGGSTESLCCILCFGRLSVARVCLLSGRVETSCLSLRSAE